MIDVDVRRMLDDYTRTVRELRAVITDARAQVDHATAVVAEAAVFAHRRRRRGRKMAALRQRAPRTGASG